MLSLFTLATFVEVIAYGQLAAFTPLHLPRIGVPPSDVAAAVGAIAVGANLFGLCFLPFWGVLADRFGRKPLIVRSFVATGSGLALAALARNVWVFGLARGLSALNLGNSGLMMTTLQERTPRRRIGLAFGILNGAGPLGATIGPLLGGPLVDRFGFAVVLALDAALLAAIVLLLSFGYRDAYVPTPERPPVMRAAFDGLALIWRSPRLRLLFPALLILFSGWMLVFIYLPLAVERIHGDDGLATAVGIALGAQGVVTLAAAPLVGAIADRFGHWRVLFAAASVDAVLWLVPFATRDYWPFVIAVAAVAGLGSGVFSLSFNVLSASASDRARARVMTFSYLPLNLGFVLGPALGALVVRADPFAMFPLASALALCGTAALGLAARQPVERYSSVGEELSERIRSSRSGSSS